MINNSSKKVIIVGSGFGGLSIAALLSKDGYDVTVLEKNKEIGGRARVWEKDGFKFDMGPSWYLMPDIFKTFFEEFNKTPDEFYKLVRLNPSYRMFFGKNDIIDISSSLDETLELFDKLENKGASKLQKYLERAKLQYDVSKDSVLYKNITSPLDFINWNLIKNGLKLNLTGSLDRKVNSSFENERLKKILLYSIVFLGANPKTTPGIYSLMSHVDFNLGVWYPLGGIGSIISAIKQIAEENGAKFNLGQEVREIKVENKLATAVITQDSIYECDLVVINADYAHAETSFFESKYQQYNEKYWSTRTIAPSAFIIYLGINKKLKNVQHHTLVLDNDWIQHFDSIFENPGWPEYPSYYVCVPSKTDSGVAPAGMENLFILVPVASDLEDSEEIRKIYSEKIIDHLENLIGDQFHDNIIVKRIFSQQDFKNDYNAYKGTALGLSHTMMQSAMFRPRHQSKKVKNVYYTGQYTHPGIGVPMCLISSTIVRDLINENY